MAPLPCQEALDRVIAYLRGCGVSPGVSECRTALQLVDHALQQSAGNNVMQLTMDLLPQYFDLPTTKVMLSAAPKLKRGSMGYE